MNKPLEELLADARLSAFVMEQIASFEPEEIDGDDTELRFELDGFDTGTNVSLVEQCGKASDIIKALILALEKSNKEQDILTDQFAENISKENKKRLQAEKRTAEIEASQLVVNLPKGRLMQSVYNSDFSDVDSWVLCISVESAIEAIRAAGGNILTLAINDVIAERNRQVNAEGWTPEHDDKYQESELADAAACYALHAHNQGFPTPSHWPWDYDWWKQTNPRRDLVKAGALILAEIERIDRAAGVSVKSEGHNG